MSGVQICVALCYTHTGMGQLSSAHLGFLTFKFDPWFREIKSGRSETFPLIAGGPTAPPLLAHGSTYCSFTPVLLQDLPTFHRVQRGKIALPD